MQPRVLLVCLTANRPQFIKRMLESYNSQTYQNKRLYVLDTGNDRADILQEGGMYAEYYPSLAGHSIGNLRNIANAYAGGKCLDAEIIAHLDVDDWSHPNRITEQVALLQSSGKQCVGYRDMLFWRDVQLSEKDVYGPEGSDDPCDIAEEAWVYSSADQSYCLGTSLCYWREVWERRPFPDLPKAKGGSSEDVEWLRGVDSLGDVSLNRTRGVNYPDEPRMIASIHGGNTQYYEPDLLEKSTSWRRAPEFDAMCRERMAP